MPENKKETEIPPPSDTTDQNAKRESEDTKKDKPIKSEDNAFSQEEMKNLESKESKVKTNLVDRIFKKKVKPPAEETNKDKNEVNLINSNTDTPENEIKTLKKDLTGATSRLDNMSITVEKLEGKMENERAVATGIEERISRLTEEIGELRSMILDRERGFNDIETGFKKIEAMAEEMQPEMIKKNLDRKERDIIQISVQMEKVDAIVSETNRQIKLFREQMDKIKSLDNLLRVSKDIEKNISKIKDTERYTGRMAAKTEELFTELDKRITQFATQSSKIDSLDELTKELMESFDKTEVKLKEAVFKEDLEKLKQSIAASDQKSTDTELSNIKSDLSSLQDNFSKLKSNIEILNIDPLTTGSISSDTTQKKSKKTPGQASEELPTIEDVISEKKLSKIKKEIEEQNKKIDDLSSSISDLKSSNTLQSDFTNELKGSQEALSSTINSEINEKTKELKSNISQMANILSIMQKKEHTSKQDIDNLKKEINEITKMRQKDDTMQQKTKKEIQLLKKTEKDTREKLKKELTEKINKLNKNIKETPSTRTNLQENSGYIKNNINGMKEPPPKYLTNTKTDTIANAITLNKESALERKNKLIEDIERTEHESIKHEAIQNIVSETAFLNENINQQPLYLNTTAFYDHDLRLNKLVRLINKAEESLNSNNIEDAKKAFNDLVSAYNTVHKKVPQPQIEEIHVLIEQLNNKLKNHTT